MLAADPENRLIEPAALWLLKNRRGAGWSGTRETAIVFLVLLDYLKQRGPAASGEAAFEILVNGTVAARGSFAAAPVAIASSHHLPDAALLRDGVNEIVLRRASGELPLSLAVEVRFLTETEDLPPHPSSPRGAR